MNGLPIMINMMNSSGTSRRWFALKSVDTHHHDGDKHDGDKHDDHHHHDDHHDDHHRKPLGPYEVPHHPTYPKEAYFLGINPNEKYKWEGWEIPTIITYTSCFLVLVYGYTANNKNAFKVVVLLLQYLISSLDSCCVHDVYDKHIYYQCNTWIYIG